MLIKDCQKQRQGSEKALYEHFFGSYRITNLIGMQGTF